MRHGTPRPARKSAGQSSRVFCFCASQLRSRSANSEKCSPHRVRYRYREPYLFRNRIRYLTVTALFRTIIGCRFDCLFLRYRFWVRQDFRELPPVPG
nr:unnamed protein product [Callosobruchus chinensis]